MREIHNSANIIKITFSKQIFDNGTKFKMVDNIQNEGMIYLINNTTCKKYITFIVSNRFITIFYICNISMDIVWKKTCNRPNRQTKEIVVRIPDTPPYALSRRGRGSLQAMLHVKTFFLPCKKNLCLLRQNMIQGTRGLRKHDVRVPYIFKILHIYRY